MRTQKQTDATKRNWKIRSIRAFHALANQFDPHRAAAIQAIVDDELRELGVETEADRRKRIKAELEGAGV